jgi:hypothetical protein
LILALAWADKCVMHEPTSARNEIKFMTSINLLHVLVPGCHPQGVFWVKGIGPNALIWVCIALIGVTKILEF